ncbi:MAG TPA: signal peptide peptidase SppA [Stellaceae bacterium]|nr:signal peptide peptidase SppA [Stellaceae bacterium]
MARLLRRVFTAIGVVTVLAIVAIAVAAWRLSARPGLPGAIVLRADLDRGLAKGAGQDALTDLLFGAKPTLRDFIDALDRAGSDPRVKGIYLRLGDDNLALATCQQVRDAIAAFRRRGKFAIVFATSFGEFGPGTRPYYLATAADEIWLQPLGSVGLIGLEAEAPFLRGLLAKIGVTPSFAHREQYKTAANVLTETAMTPPQREETGDLLDQDAAQIVAGIAADRKLPAARIAALIDKGPLLADDARTVGLVDRIGYRDEARARALARAGAGAKFVALKRYLDAAGRPHSGGGPKIALIYGTGLIVADRGADNAVLGSDELSARAVVRAFDDAARDPEVKAILFRIDSPGGSAVASETIWRAVMRAKDHGKPVIVSMGDVAGSGGYYIAAPADKIVAEPATLTGSIGVLAGKLVIAGLLDKLGIGVDSVERGANAAMFSALSDFSPAAEARLNAFLDATYAGFKARVAAGRHMPMSQVETVAKGRVWTGAEAKRNGLVDALGGYDTALQLAKEAAKIPAGTAFRVAVFPAEKSLFERLYARLENRDSDGDAGLLGSAGGAASAVAGLFGAAVTVAAPGILEMPSIGEIR